MFTQIQLGQWVETGTSQVPSQKRARAHQLDSDWERTRPTWQGDLQPSRTNLWGKALRALCFEPFFRFLTPSPAPAQSPSPSPPDTY